MLEWRLLQRWKQHRRWKRIIWRSRCSRRTRRKCCWCWRWWWWRRTWKNKKRNQWRRQIIVSWISDVRVDLLAVDAKSSVGCVVVSTVAMPTDGHIIKQVSSFGIWKAHGHWRHTLTTVHCPPLPPPFSLPPLYSSSLPSVPLLIVSPHTPPPPPLLSLPSLILQIFSLPSSSSLSFSSPLPLSSLPLPLFLLFFSLLLLLLHVIIKSSNNVVFINLISGITVSRPCSSAAS